MISETVAVGSELLLGGSVDTNSAWIGEKLAENGISCHFQVTVGDNKARIASTLRAALERSDAVIVTGGLGPTQDDITREAIAEVMGVALVFDVEQRNRIAAIFESRNREMAASNERQAWRPDGSDVIEQRRGTAPGLVCPVGTKVIYALPGVPHEMKEMVERVVLPQLRERSGESAVIRSRTVRTWGVAESTLSEMIAPRIDALDEPGAKATIAFLAHGVEGIHVRVTARAASAAEADAILDGEESELRALLGALVFGTDDETMETAVADLLMHRQLTLGIAESLTGGLIASRLTSIPGGSSWFRGGIVSYASDVKFEVLDVPEGPVVTADAACAMAEGARQTLGASVGMAVTGVAGPTSQEDQPVGLVYGALAMPDEPAQAIEFRLSGDRRRIREFACINVLDALRRRLLMG